MAEIRLTEHQQSVVDHSGSALLVSAGAGSGKTRVLVERLVKRIAGGQAEADRFLVITYTRAAAAELRGRILAALHERLRADPKNPALRRQILLLRQARIGTIHSLCAAILRDNAHLLGIRPDFRQLEGAEERVLQQETLHEVLAARYETMSPGFRALADTMGAGLDDRKLAETVLDTYRAVQSHPQPEEWLLARREAPNPDGDMGATPWGALLLDRAARQARFWRLRLEEALSGLEGEAKAEASYGPGFRDVIAQLTDLEAALAGGWDAACAFGPVMFPALRGFPGIGKLPAAARAKARWDECRKAMAELGEVFSQDSAAHREDLAALRPVTDELLSLVEDFSRAYAGEKRRRGVLDFSDLEHLAFRLLTDPEDRNRPSPLARELSERFDEILVDEYQDCNRVQDCIFFALSREGQNVTMVGDVKQSIYRFRLADPTLFLEKYRRYGDAPRPGQGRRILLPENFRSDGGILGPVNEFFSAVMSRELGDLDYGEKEALRPGPEAGSTEGAFRLFVTQAGEEGLSAEAEEAAGYVAWLLQSGMTVPEAGARRPLEPGDVAILLRAVSGRDGIYAEALRKRGIPAVCLKSDEDLELRPEVRWALSLLEIIDNPRQDIPLLTALRSPMFRFSEDRLGQIRSRDRKHDFYEALLLAREEEDCRAFLEKLERWRARSRLVPAEQLLEELCGETDLRALAEAAEGGASANLDVLIDAARDYASGGKSDLYSFVTYLREARELKKSALTARPGGGKGVVITTIHGAKGLEYPVVLLADLAHRFNRQDLRKPLLVHPELGVGAKRIDTLRGITYTTLPRMAITRRLTSEELSEELRVLYVAMTRARQHLALFCRVKDREKERAKRSGESALPLAPEQLEKALSPADWVLTASLALGGAGAWEWRSAPQGEWTTPAEEARPEEEAVSPEEVRRRLGWRYSRPADTRLPSKLTATALRAGFAAEEAAQGAETLPVRQFTARDFPAPGLDAGGALGPAEKGTAMHLAMQYVDFGACTGPEETAGALEALRARWLLTPEQAAAVDPARILAFCRSEVMGLLRRGTLHREFKFSLLAPVREFLGEGEGETLLQGVVDLWSELPEGILLLDYKTDRVSRTNQTARAQEYAPQLRAYAWALEKITGKKVLRRFLWFFATGESVEVWE